MLPFTKMNGAGNDFVMVDNRDLRFQLSKADIARLCDRHRGIGADGLIAVEPALGSAHFRMRYYNADGGEAEMCGNGARCFGRFAARLGGRTDLVTFETLAGEITAELLGDKVRLAMSQPHSMEIGIRLEVASIPLEVHSVNTGVPHAVVWVDDLQKTEVRSLGSALRHHTHFAPKGTNANFAQRTGPGSIAIRTYERGVEDETLACGTGMVASALIAHKLFGMSSPIQVKVQGGDTLSIGFVSRPDGFEKVTLTGPADFVFEGTAPL